MISNQGGSGENGGAAAHAPSWRLAILLAMLAMIGPMSIDAVFPAFPQIGNQFGVNSSSLQQIVSIYLVTYGIGSLFHGPLSDWLGRKPVIILSLVLYAISTALIAFAVRYNDLLFLRGCQGLFAGAGFVVARAMVRDIFDEVQSQRMLGSIVLISGIAPAVAPIFGAVILGWWNWTITFVLLSLCAAALAIACGLFLTESLPAERRVTMHIRALADAYRGLVYDRQFFWLCAAGAFNYSSIFLLISSSPAIILEHLGLTIRDFPYFYAPLISGMMMGAWLSRIVTWGRAPHAPIRYGFVVMISGAALNLLIAVLAPGLWKVAAFGLFLQGSGVQLAFPSITVSLFRRCPQYLGLGSSLQGFFALITNAAVAGIVSPLLSIDLIHLALGALGLIALGFVAYLLASRRSIEGASL